VFLKTLTNRIRRHFEKRTKVSLLSPAKLMHAMNEELRALETGKHLTVFCGVIDTNKQTLTYALAAHYPPAFLCQHGEVMPLVGNGLPLGLFVDAQFEEHEVALAAQFSIVALSDGILELLPTGDLPSKEALLKAHVAAAATDFEALNLRLGLPTAKDLPDDIALLMITRYE
jgi:serine phosphatase RsbU (regulator of sigma subunit)